MKKKTKWTSWERVPVKVRAHVRGQMHQNILELERAVYRIAPDPHELKEKELLQLIEAYRLALKSLK